MNSRKQSEKRKHTSSSSTSSIEHSPVSKMASKDNSTSSSSEVTDTTRQFTIIMERLNSLFKSDDFENAVSVIVERVCSQMSDKIEYEMSKINTRLNEVASKQENLEAETEDLRSALNHSEVEIKSLKEENECLKRGIITAQQKTNDNEQYNRLEGIRVHGIEETPNENCKEKICNILNGKLGLDIKPSDISKIHRLDQMYRREGKPRPIILRFDAHYHKRECIVNRRKLKGTGIVISEDLTQLNYGVLNRAYKHECVESVWSTEGKLFAKLKQGPRIRLFAYKNIDDTIADAVNNRRPTRISDANSTPLGNRLP